MAASEQRLHKAIMAKIDFLTNRETYRRLMGNGLSYSVPRFQRDYSWGQDEWEELWQDIQEVLGKDAPSTWVVWS